VSDARKLKTLETENARLKELLADSMLDNSTLKAAAALKVIDKCDISQRRACRLVSVDTKTVRREPEPGNPGIRQRMREIAATRRRFGYRRIAVMPHERVS